MTAPPATPWTFQETLPPVTGRTAVTLVQGQSFVICDDAGDVDGAGHGALHVAGVFVADTRICSALVLTVDGERVEPLASATEASSRGRFVGRVMPDGGAGGGGPADGGPILVRRRHRVGGGLQTEVRLRNPSRLPRAVAVTITVGTDLAGLFEVKERRAPGTPAPVHVVGGELRFGADDGSRGTVVRARPAGTVGTDAAGAGTVSWSAQLPPRGEWVATVEVVAVRGGAEVALMLDEDEPADLTLAPGGEPEIKVRSDVVGLTRAVESAVVDLRALRIQDPEHPDEVVVAAGAPWFMTLFGRDSLLTAHMALLVDPALALGTLRALARLQGRATLDDSDEQPGKILHEVRFGAAPSLALSSGSVYYGSVDATPLFVMLVNEVRRWGVPPAELAPLLPAVDAACDWMAGPGDVDGDGFLEYQRATPAGLANQGWKDSGDGVAFADGRLPRAPIALAEVQGYAYAAWLAGADLADAFGDAAAAGARRARAAALRTAFNRDFWSERHGAYALALDGDKVQVDAVASNMGHCLWCGIVDPERVPAVAAWLTHPDLASGWGVRTLATSMARYDPLSYHNGSVWPHDTALAIAGLRRRGHVHEANRLVVDLLAASAEWGGRLPELFAGLTPGELPVPVPYPNSCSPQAWSAASPLLLVRHLLGLEPDVPRGVVEIDPVLPPGRRYLRVSGVPIAGERVEIEVEDDAVAARGLPRGLALLRRA